MRRLCDSPKHSLRYFCRSRSLLRPTAEQYTPLLVIDSNIIFFVASCLTIRRRRSAPLERTQHPNYSPILGFTSQAFVRSPTSYIPLSLFVLKYCSLISYLSSFVDVILQARVALALSDSDSVTTALESDLEPFDKLRRYEMKAVSVFRYHMGLWFFGFRGLLFGYFLVWLCQGFFPKQRSLLLGKSPIYAPMSTSFI